MAKFHINGNGEAGSCKAEKGGCPFGGESEHFTSAEAARSAYEAQKSAENVSQLRKPFPNLDEVYSKAPRGDIGFAKAVSNLKGLQRDIDSGFVKPEEIPGRMAYIAERLELRASLMDSHDPKSEAAVARAAYVKKLQKLSRGAEPIQPLSEQPQWKDVLVAVQQASYSRVIAADKKQTFLVLGDRLRGEGLGYDGYSEKDSLIKAQNVRDSLARVRNPQLLTVANKLDAALKADGRLS